ncbi:MAG: hypothetical protein BWX99_02706 [Deltaproteobacteria bacterium ADurb.Bin151]|nr:MAG: hypothetical protein BWX99_02706 [Deltaproteobacteria bacterium ADurb.Bin151]
MPRIPVYTRKESVPGVGGNVPMNNSGLAAAKEMGNAVQGFTNEFADLVTKQAEDLRQRDIAIEKVNLSNMAREYSIEQQANYDTNANATKSVLELDDYSTQSKKQFNDNFRKAIGIENIKHPEVRIYAEELSGRIHGEFIGYTAKKQAEIRTAFTDKAIGDGVRISIESVMSGGDVNANLKYTEDMIKEFNKKGSINVDQATDATIKAQQEIVKAHLEYLAINNKKQFVQDIETGKWNHILGRESKEYQKQAKILNDEQKETDALDVVTKAHAKEGYIDYVGAVSTVLSPDFIKRHELTMNQAQNIASSLNALDKAQSQSAIDEVNQTLVPLALQRNGLNKQSDLTPAQWIKLNKVAPEYSAKLQDAIRRERDYQERANRAEARDRRAELRDIERDRKQRQTDNETTLMLSSDFVDKNLDEELATGNIGKTEYNRLKTLQKQMDPINRDSVKEALKQINTGTALKKAVKESDASQLAIWRMKYGELIKTWAVNNANDPNFDVKLTEFMESHVLSPLVTDLFMSRSEEQKQKYFNARAAAGPGRQTNQPVQNKQTYTQADLEFTAKKHNMTVDQVKQKLGIK